MLNVIFIIIICLLVSIIFGITCKYLSNKEWRKATFSGVVTIFTPVETFLFLQQRNNQTELTYLIDQLKTMNLYAYLILFLYLLIIGYIVYYLYAFLTRKKKQNEFGN